MFASDNAVLGSVIHSYRRLTYMWFHVDGLK
jgi:hypothetical protein